MSESVTYCTVVARLVSARGRIVAEEVRVAEGFGQRARGLVAYPELPERVGLLLPRAWQIHTFGVRYPIDVIFCGREGEVLRVVRGMRPLRMTRPVIGSRWVLEMREGGAEGVAKGDRLLLHQSFESDSPR